MKKEKEKKDEKELFEERKKYYYINSIGSDEVGTGDFFGPVVVTAFHGVGIVVFPFFGNTVESLRSSFLGKHIMPISLLIFSMQNNTNGAGANGLS